jgi:RNA polymerase-binding transcription factor DksA
VTKKIQDKTPAKAVAKTRPEAKIVEIKPEPAKVVEVTPTKKPVKPGAKSAKAVSPSKSAENPKHRSHHLQKLLALREKTHKVRKVGEGLSSAVKKAPSAAAQAAAEQQRLADAKVAEEKAKAKAARPKKAHYTKAELAELRAMLQDERERLLNDLRQLDDLADSNRQTTHATFSSHQADAASDSAALESTYIQRRYEEERFAMVSEAMLKLDAGTYGLCELCADEPHGKCGTCPYIPIERLKAKPFAKLCVQLRAEMEKKNRR